MQWIHCYVRLITYIFFTVSNTTGCPLPKLYIMQFRFGCICQCSEEFISVYTYSIYLMWPYDFLVVRPHPGKEVFGSVFKFGITKYKIVNCPPWYGEWSSIYIMKLLPICILILSHSFIFCRFYFLINVYMVLSLFNNVIYVFLLLWLYILTLFMYDYPDWGFSVLFPQL
jgi:hypothetical protein